jgi:hypothetical protein
MVNVLFGILKKETMNNQKIVDKAINTSETQQQQLQVSL